MLYQTAADPHQPLLQSDLPMRLTLDRLVSPSVAM
jgi:hypothetical protein